TAEGLDAEKPQLKDTFVYSLIEGHQIAPWLRPVYYPMPPDKVLRAHYVSIFEVAPEQTPEEANVRLAEWQMAMGNQVAALNSLNTALKINPNYLPAFIYGMRLDNAAGRTTEAALLMQKIRGLLGQANGLELEDRL